MRPTADPCFMLRERFRELSGLCERLKRSKLDRASVAVARSRATVLFEITQAGLHAPDYRMPTALLEAWNKALEGYQLLNAVLVRRRALMTKLEREMTYELDEEMLRFERPFFGVKRLTGARYVQMLTHAKPITALMFLLTTETDYDRDEDHPREQNGTLG